MLVLTGVINILPIYRHFHIYTHVPKITAPTKLELGGMSGENPDMDKLGERNERTVVPGEMS